MDTLRKDRLVRILGWVCAVLALLADALLAVYIASGKFKQLF